MSGSELFGWGDKVKHTDWDFGFDEAYRDSNFGGMVYSYERACQIEVRDLRDLLAENGMELVRAEGVCIDEDKVWGGSITVNRNGYLGSYLSRVLKDNGYNPIYPDDKEVYEISKYLGE